MRCARPLCEEEAGPDCRWCYLHSKLAAGLIRMNGQVESTPLTLSEEMFVGLLPKAREHGEDWAPAEETLQRLAAREAEYVALLRGLRDER